MKWRPDLGFSGRLRLVLLFNPAFSAHTSDNLLLPPSQELRLLHIPYQEFEKILDLVQKQIERIPNVKIDTLHTSFNFTLITSVIN